MKTLIIHHLESCWESGYKKSGYSFSTLCDKFREYLEGNTFDKVILTRFEEWDFEYEHYLSGLAEHIDRIEEYGYGWSKECVCGNDEDFCEGGSHSELVYIADWMKELSGDISISGAFDFECIEDLEIALRHLELPFKRIEELII